MKTLDSLKADVLKVKGVDKARKARLGDGIFVKYGPVNGHVFTDFISLDSWANDLKRTKVEYERFFI